MFLVIALLVVIVLILLFGAQAVKARIANGCGMLVLGVVLVGVLLVAQKMTGEQWLWFIGGTVVIATMAWIYAAWSEKRAEEILGNRKDVNGFATTLPKKPEPQSPLESLMHVFEEYDSRTVPATKVKAQELFALGDEEGLRQLVESICERNKDHLEFDGKRYSRRGYYEGGRF